MYLFELDDRFVRQLEHIQDRLVVRNVIRVARKRSDLTSYVSL